MAPAEQKKIRATNTVTLGNSREKPQSFPKQFQEGSSEKVMLLIAWLKCIYSNAYSLGDKQDLEVMAQLENYDLIVIVEMLWDDSHDWSMMIKSYKIFKRDRKGRKGSDVALYVERWIECKELSLRTAVNRLRACWWKSGTGSITNMWWLEPSRSNLVWKSLWTFLLQL